MNVFSGHISEGWRDFSRGIDQKPKAIWSQRFFGVHLRALAGLFAEYRPKAEGCLELHFFELSQRVAREALQSVGKGSRKRTGVNIFPGYISEGWKGFLLSIDPKPEAVRSYTFSGHRSRLLEWFSAGN